MFDGGAQDPRPAGVLVPAGPEQALDGQVVCFGSSRGENDLRRMGASCCGQHFTGILDGAPGASTRSVQRGRIAGSRQLPRHDGERFCRQGRGGSVIEVYRHLAILPMGPGTQWSLPRPRPCKTGSNLAGPSLTWRDHHKLGRRFSTRLVQGTVIRASHRNIHRRRRNTEQPGHHYSGVPARCG